MSNSRLSFRVYSRKFPNEQTNIIRKRFCMLSDHAFDDAFFRVATENRDSVPITPNTSAGDAVDSLSDLEDALRMSQFPSEPRGTVRLDFGESDVFRGTFTQHRADVASFTVLAFKKHSIITVRWPTLSKGLSSETINHIRHLMEEMPADRPVEVTSRCHDRNGRVVLRVIEHCSVSSSICYFENGVGYGTITLTIRGIAITVVVKEMRYESVNVVLEPHPSNGFKNPELLISSLLSRLWHFVPVIGSDLKVIDCRHDAFWLILRAAEATLTKMYPLCS